MGLETGSYISNLVSSNPTGADRKLQGDDHLRLIKSTIQNSFPGITGAVLVSGANGGVVNAYTLTPTPPLVSYVVNMTVIFSPTITNTGATTLNISGLGPLNVLTVDGAALAAGDLIANQIYTVRYNGTDLRIDTLTKRYVDQLAFSSALPGQGGNNGKFLTTDGVSASWSDTVTIPFNFNSRLNEAKGANIASSATIDLSTATGNLVHVTGTTTITAITIPSGAERTVVFDGVLTLTHNATTLILPTGANITTAAGDTIIVRGDGVGNARVISYNKANGNPVATQPVYGSILLATLTPTASPLVNALNVFNASYDAYHIEINGIRPAADDFILMQFAVAGVADTGANYYSANFAGTISGTSTSLALTDISNTALAAGRGLSGFIKINNVNSTVTLKTATWLCNYQSTAAPQFVNRAQAGIHAPANVITGVRFLLNGGGNFTAGGSIRIYGISNV